MKRLDPHLRSPMPVNGSSISFSLKFLLIVSILLMSRCLVLRALLGLPHDIQQLIFRMCLPSEQQIRNRLEKQTPCLPEWARLDSAIVNFVHGNQAELELGSLSPQEKRYAYFRGHIFGLQHFCYPGPDSRVMVLLKPNKWSYSDEEQVIPQQFDQLFPRRQIYWCDDCGKEENGIPVRMHRGIICHGCYGSLLSMGEADENGWMEELSFGMVGF